MQRIKMMLLAMVAVFAIGAVGASAASAGTVSGLIETSVGDCAFDGTHGGWSADGDGWSANAGNFVKDTPCDVDSIAGNATLYKEPYEADLDEDGYEIDPENNNGYAEVSNVSVQIKATVPLFGQITCNYNVAGPVAGIWYWWPYPTNKRFEFGPIGPLNPAAGSTPILCPSVTITKLTVDASNP